MADNIQLVTFPGSLVTAQYDAILQEIETGDSGVITGCTVSMSSANTLHITEGFGSLCGREFHLFDCTINITLSSSGTKNGRVYLHMDLSNTAEPISIRTEVASTLTPPVQGSNVNINNGVYEINLATFSVGTLTISNVVNVAPILEAGGAGLSNLAYVEKTAVASQSYLKGQYLVLSGQFYEVTKSTGISSGTALVPGNNITARTVGEVLYTLNSSSGDNIVFGTVDSSSGANVTFTATGLSNITKVIANGFASTTTTNARPEMIVYMNNTVYGNKGNYTTFTVSGNTITLKTNTTYIKRVFLECFGN